jgi:hypothetical protein
MDGKNRLTLRGLVLAPVDNAAREQLQSRLSLPLGTALEMLRDRHDTHTPNLPVSGDVDSTEFDISDAVSTAVSKAVKKASLTYLTVALQPYGALISSAKLAGEAAEVTGGKPGDNGPVGPVRIGDEQLLDLAARRAEAVTDYLVSRHGVSASRLVACRPFIDSTPAGKGRADLLI